MMAYWHSLRLAAGRLYLTLHPLRQVNACIPKQTCRSQSNISLKTTPPRNPLMKAVYYIKNDPFARVSLVFGGVVLTVLLIVESFIPKSRKKIKPQLSVLPPHTSHLTVPRNKELSTLLHFLPSVFSQKPSVVMVTGPSGSGKTELTLQFVKQFLTVSSPRISRKESSKPIIVYLDATSLNLLDQSVNFVASLLGIKSQELYSSNSRCHDDKVQQSMSTVLNKLSTQKAKWLLIVDGVCEESYSIIKNSLEGVVNDRIYRKGYILLTSQEEMMPFSLTGRISLTQGLSQEEANELFSKLTNSSPNAPDNQLINELLSYLHYSPLTIALAALTARLYSHFYQSADNTETDITTIVSDYHDMLKESCDILKESHDSHVLNKVMALYIEALCAIDNHFLHSLDFLSLCNTNYSIPSATIKQHLKNPFYKLSSTPSSSLLEDTPTVTPLIPPPSLTSYISLIKSKLPFIGGTSPPLENTPVQPPSLPDLIKSLRLSPFIRSRTLGQLELFTVHTSCKDHLSNHFLMYTVPRMEEEHLKVAQDYWNKTAWFKKFRGFDSTNSLVKFRSNLPGLKEGKVLTEEQYKLMTNDVSYYQYIHLVSHYHRFVNTLTNELKYLSRDLEDLTIRQYIKPHLELVLSNQLAERDLLRCQAGLLSIEASFSTDQTTIYNQYCTLLELMREAFGSTHQEIANTLTAMAEIQYYKGDYGSAGDLLTSAIALHEQTSSHLRTPTQSMDLAASLSTLGLVYASLGERQLCREKLEKALSLFQTIPSDGDIPKKQRKLVATTVTDLGHAYVSTGDIIGAKKYLDLALIAQRGIHGDDHPEVARTLNVLSIVYSLMGDNSESRNSRKEAGKIQSELLKQSDVI